ncbi:MAG: DUF3311 domain-containing protein [Planctomycetes bacterium]|nr:DUF3311 domain-containing protein [Planctomycetota bacterium]
MKYAVWILVGLLLVFHQDYWQWSNTTLDFGFLPRTLTYHVGVSIAAAIVWALATKFCWPEGLDEESEHSSQEDAGA